MILCLRICFNKTKELRQLEQAANLTYTTEPSRRFNSFYDDHDYEESTIPLNEIVSQIPSSIAIIPVLSTLEPEDSLIMRDEYLSTIPEKESGKLIKFSVKDLVPILKGKSVTFFNPLFDSNDDFTSSDDESLSDEDVLKDNDIECKESYDSNFDESNLLVTPLSDSNEDEFFDPGDDIELLLHHDSSTPKISVVSILEGFTGDILYLESLLSNDIILSLPLEVFLDHDPRSLSDINDFKIMVKVFDPGIHKKNLQHMIAPDYEDSRARGFVHHPLDLQSFACLYMGI
ncbi:hypothetical protein Tco_0643304 [Tanacetum coccineum]